MILYCFISHPTDKATRQYNEIARLHSNVTVTQIDATTDPSGIADKLLDLVKEK